MIVNFPSLKQNSEGFIYSHSIVTLNLADFPITEATTVELPVAPRLYKEYCGQDIEEGELVEVLQLHLYYTLPANPSERISHYCFPDDWLLNFSDR